ALPLVIFCRARVRPVTHLRVMVAEPGRGQALLLSRAGPARLTSVWHSPARWTVTWRRSDRHSGSAIPSPGATWSARSTCFSIFPTVSRDVLAASATERVDPGSGADRHSVSTTVLPKPGPPPQPSASPPAAPCWPRRGVLLPARSRAAGRPEALGRFPLRSD